MVDRNTIARILVIIGLILQLFYLVANGFFGFIIFVVVILGSIFAPDDPLRDLAVMTMLSLFLSAFLGFIFMIVWIVLATNPGGNRKWLIISGLLAFIINGLVPSFLAYSLVGTL